MRRIDPKEPVPLKALGGPADQVHVFDEQSVWAVNTALAAERPLLVRGEPGIGKSQLARAAAVCLKRAFVSHVVDSRSESRDLLWHFDAVARLADAQVMSAVGRKTAGPIRTHLPLRNYVRPGPLWWVFDWSAAKAQADRVGSDEPPNTDRFLPDNGCVLLIDEIDKAESDVPNGLLEALGSGSFLPLGRAEPVKARADTPPFVVITTNEERALPDAFVRRCVVLNLRFREEPAFLVERGRAHFGLDQVADPVLERAADLTLEDRRVAQQDNVRKPGQAEYLDLVRAVIHLAPGDTEQQCAALDRAREFVLKKQGSGAV